MSSNDSSSDEEETHKLHKFSLVHFVHKGKKRKVEDIDIVPTKWLKFDYGRGRCTTQYVPASSDPEDYEVLHDLVKMLADAPESYTSYSINIKGSAQTYKEALVKLDKLKDHEHAFSLESEESASEVQKKMESSVKRQNLQREAEKMQQLMETNAKDFEKTNENVPIIKKNKKNTNKNADTTAASTSYTHTNNNDDQPASTSNSSDNVGHIYHEFVKNQVDAPSTHEQPLKIGLPCTSNAAHEVPLPQDVIASLDLPVINIQNMKCSTPFENAVMTYLIHLTKSIEDIKKHQKKTDEYLLDKRVVNILNSKVDFQTKYGLEVPFSTMDHFDAFNEELKINKFMKNDICHELMLHLDKDFVLTKSYVNMLKRFLTKGLAVQYTAVRASTDKSKVQFRGNEFSKCMDVVVCGTRAEKGLQTDEKDMISALSNVLCNVKKWNN